jgi:hypothetical protein
MNFHLLLIESIRVRRAHLLRVVVAFFGEQEKRERSSLRRRRMPNIGTNPKARYSMDSKAEGTAS